MSDGLGFNWQMFAKWVESLDLQGKLMVVARIAHQLTMAARDTYEPGTRGVTDPVRLRSINEIMHRLTRRIVDLGRGLPGDLNEAEFWESLAELCNGPTCAEDLATAASSAADSRRGV